MSAYAIHDILSAPPPAIESPFELAALRITAGWLESRPVSATLADLRLAGEFLRTLGITIDPMPDDRRVRLVSEQGRESIVSREAAMLLAIRILAARESQRSSSRLVPRAA